MNKNIIIGIIMVITGIIGLMYVIILEQKPYILFIISFVGTVFILFGAVLMVEK